MAAPITTTPTFDDGLYHPFIPAPVIPSTPIIAAPVAVAPVAAAIPESTISTPPVISQSVPISVSSFKPTASATSIASMPSGTSISSMHSDKPTNLHSTTVVISVLIIVAVFLIVSLYGYLTSQGFRLWKERKWSRYPENEWKVSGGRPTPSMSEGSQRESTTGLISNEKPDPFRHVQRKSRLQSFLNLGRASHSNGVEQTDEERGWLWGTRQAKDNLTRLTTPGLGVGKYRAKYGTHTSRGFRYAVGRSVDVPDLSTQEAAPMAPGESLLYEEKEDLEGPKEELFYDYAQQASQAFNYDHHNSHQGHPENSAPTGVSYLLTKLKDSISGRTKFSSLGSSNSRGRWNEVGRYVNEDDLEDCDEKLDGLEPQSHHLPLRPELSLADIALPSVPAYTWDANSTIKISKQKRCRESTLDSHIPAADSREFLHHSSQLSTNAGSPQRPLAPPKSRKLPPIPSNSADTNVASSSRHQSRRSHKSRSAITASSSSSSSSTLRAKRKGTSVSGSKKLKNPSSTKPSNEIYPGGFVGRAPTKKLRRKASPEY
ncbi:hypothetical protein PSTT_11030 [Puccinia striiformis]|uniref:Uncharacterized protein n=1 Tax=Puccinia striiformis TaxID=27350 RepID=A0A2S4V1W1_9BASI|nr:hypothetical protein PSTT_11030 [Puccinia striiformis]